MKVKTLKKNKGITLIEIVVALALFAIIITPLMKNFLTASKVNNKGRKVMIATDVAQDIMEGFAGKSYEDVIQGLDDVTGGFGMSISDNSAKYAFSSINEGYYNMGGTHAVQVNFPSDKITDINPGRITFSADIVSKYGAIFPDSSKPNSWRTVSSNENDSFVASRPIPLEEVVATSVLTDAFLMGTLKAPSDPAHKVLGPYEDRQPILEGGVVKKDSNGYTVYPESADKRLYFGYSDDGSKPAESIPRQHLPRMAYMVYTRVNKDQYYFDVVVVFTPMADTESATDNDYFTYNVKLTVYEYTYEETVSEDGTTLYTSSDRYEADIADPTYITFGRTPLVTLEGGMMSRNQKTD
ncbi:MAG: type II secretion system protein [Lachnospiraceae bacterium]|nr:type II secretion system protein [Lachnospiraceae bacterium]